MATKTEIFAEAMKIVEKHGLDDSVKAEFVALLEPKKAGAQFNIEDIANIVDGEAQHIFDSIFKVWVPVYDAEGNPNFYEKPDTELGWSRFSRAAEKARKDAEKQYKATKDAVLADVMAGEIEASEVKELMEAAEAARKELVIPEGFGTTERPEV